MITLALLLLLALVAGYAIHCHRLADKAETRATQRTTERDKAETEAAVYLRKIGDVAAEKAHAVIRADNLASALAFENGQRVAAEAELDRLQSRHHVLLSLDGIRADRAEGITYTAPEAVAVDSVVTLLKKRGRA